MLCEDLYIIWLVGACLQLALRIFKLCVQLWLELHSSVQIAYRRDTRPFLLAWRGLARQAIKHLLEPPTLEFTNRHTTSLASYPRTSVVDGVNNAQSKVGSEASHTSTHSYRPSHCKYTQHPWLGNSPPHVLHSVEVDKLQQSKQGQ